MEAKIENFHLIVFPPVIFEKYVTIVHKTFIDFAFYFNC